MYIWGQTLTILHRFAHCRSIYPSDEPLYLFQLGDQVVLKTWKTQGLEQQLAEQWSSPCDVLLTTYPSLNLMGIKPWTHHAQIKWALPEEGSDLTAALDTARDSWTCTPKGDFRFLFQKGAASPKGKWQYYFLFYHCFWPLLYFTPMLGLITPLSSFPRQWSFLFQLTPLLGAAGATQSPAVG